jgi:hypothetical protein
VAGISLALRQPRDYVHVPDRDLARLMPQAPIFGSRSTLGTYTVTVADAAGVSDTGYLLVVRRAVASKPRRSEAYRHH